MCSGHERLDIHGKFKPENLNVDLQELQRWHEFDSTGLGQGPVDGCHEHSYDPWVP